MSAVNREVLKDWPCSHEEADSRLMVHVSDADKNHHSITSRTVDSDVVLVMYVLTKTSITELCIAF